MLSILFSVIVGLFIAILIFLISTTLSTFMVYSRRFLPNDVFDEIHRFNTSTNNNDAGIIFFFEDANTLPIGYFNKTLNYLIPYYVTVRDVRYLIYRYSDKFEFFEALRVGYRTYTDEQLELHEWKLFCKNSLAELVKEGKYNEEDINYHRTFLSKFGSSREFQDYFKSKTDVNIEYGKDV